MALAIICFERQHMTLHFLERILDPGYELQGEELNDEDDLSGWAILAGRTRE